MSTCVEVSGRGVDTDTDVRAYLSKSLERPDEWTDEARARASYQLGQILCLLHRDGDAEFWQEKAQAARNKYWDLHALYLPTGIAEPHEDTIYDHLVPFEAGRPTLGNFLLPLSKTPRLNEICRQLLNRLRAVDQQVLSPPQLTSLLKISELIPIEESA